MKRRALASSKGPPQKKRKLASSLAVTQGFGSATSSRKPEQKNGDGQVNSPTNIGSPNAVITSLFSPDQGTGPTEHIGRKIDCTSLQWKWQSSYAPTTTGSSAMRLLIVYDRQPNAALPAVTDVVTFDNIVAFMNLNNSKRFLVIVNEEFDGLSVQGPNAFFKKGYVSFKKRFKCTLPTEFNGVNGGTIADITTGSFVAFTWQNGSITTAAPNDLLLTRIRYIDN